jgi:tetratricopeptide (TPR) repeat protein
MDHDLDAVQDQIDDIEINLDGHEAKVVALERLVAGAAPGSPGWAELVLVLCDHQQALGWHETAIAQLEAVRAAGVETEPSVEAHLLSAHLSAGNDAVVADLDRELRARSRETYLGSDYDWVGEAYEEAGRLKEALRWFSMANRDVDPDDVDMLEPFALAGRWRVRQSLGLPADAYDEAARTVRELDRARWAADNG